MLFHVDLYCTKRHHSGLKCIKIVGGWGSAPDPAGGASSAPPDPLAGLGEGEGRGRGGEGRGGEERGGEGRGGEGKKSVQALLFLHFKHWALLKRGYKLIPITTSLIVNVS